MISLCLAGQVEVPPPRPPLSPPRLINSKIKERHIVYERLLVFVPNNP